VDEHKIIRIMDCPRRTGRPRLYDGTEASAELTDTVDYLRCLNMNWSQIARDLSVGRTWLTEWRRDNNYQDPCQQTNISDDDLDVVVASIMSNHAARGEVFLKSELRNNHNIYVTRERLQLSLLRVDPEGRELRRTRTIRRRFYNVTGPHLLWHIDSTHKLRCFNLSIQGAIDGGTRVCTLLRCYDNNDSETNLMNFVAACEEYMVYHECELTKVGKMCLFVTICCGREGWEEAPS
jgi:hypothetical protein